ncbi:MAG: TolC family protein [Gammaproteobacteria bacterium]|nr:TolC family protein [Gammaproteobacteria bacterium]
MSKHSTAAQIGISGFLLALLLAMPAAATPETDEPAVLRIADALVAEALESNLGLDAVEAGVDQRLAALDMARARFLPALDLQLRYSRADGGREIELPVGDLLNPVYSSLNALLAASGQPAPFTPIANQSFSFLREREQDSVLRLSQPLYDARIAAARRQAMHGYDAARYGLDAYRLQLERDVRQAYYRWLASREAAGILSATLDLARENERVNESLHRNGKVTRDLVLRAEADRLEIDQQLIRARATESLARRYVNLLCNAQLTRELEAVAVTDADLPRLAARVSRPAGATAAALQLEETALAHRAELRQLEAGVAAAGESERIARAAFKPQVALAVDAGTQGADWDYRDQDPYVMASVIVRFNLFSGGADRASVRAARARSAELVAGRALAEQQIRIQVHEALSDLEVAEASLTTASRRAEAAAAAFEIISKKRDLGQVSPAEYLDAQRALTAARLNGNVTRYDAFAALAQVEYAIGGVEH